MGTIPNGLQQHVLWDMDGRQWIENIHSTGPSLERALEKGYAKMIPQDKLREFISTIK